MFSSSLEAPQGLLSTHVPSHLQGSHLHLSGYRREITCFLLSPVWALGRLQHLTEVAAQLSAVYEP